MCERAENIDVEAADPVAFRINQTHLFGVIAFGFQIGEKPHTRGDVKTSPPKINNVATGAQARGLLNECRR